MSLTKESVLAINCGSSSIKFAIYQISEPLTPRLIGKIDRIGLSGASLVLHDLNQSRQDSSNFPATDFRSAANLLFDSLEKQIGFASVSAVGHRVVHGMHHTEPESVSQGLLDDLNRISSYDPDHLPGEIELIKVFRQRYPKLPQVACFDRLVGFSFAEVLTSPLQRARRTAELAGFGESAQADPDLMEWDYGAYEGRRTIDIRTERPGWDLLKDGCPSGETADAVGARADRVIGRIRALGSDVLIFAHRDILRILAARWLNLRTVEARYFYLTTTSLSILGYDHNLDEPVIHLWNDARHL